MLRSTSLGLLFLAACTSTSTTAGMKARAASDWDCPESAIDVTNEGQSVFRVRGCGKTALYDCSGGSSPPAGSPPQADPTAATEYQYDGVGQSCAKVSR